MTTAQGQAAPPAGADVLLAGEGGQVLAGRVEQAEGGRLVIVLDGAGEPAAGADWPLEYSAEDRVAQLAMLLAAPGLYAALATARNLGVIWEHLMTRARRLLGGAAAAGVATGRRPGRSGAHGTREQISSILAGSGGLAVACRAVNAATPGSSPAACKPGRAGQVAGGLHQVAQRAVQDGGHAAGGRDACAGAQPGQQDGGVAAGQLASTPPPPTPQQHPGYRTRSPRS